MKTIIRLLFLFSCWVILLTQTINAQYIRCGVEDLSAEEVNNLRTAFEQWLAEGNRVLTSNVTIPVAFHIIRYDNGDADVTDQQILNQLQVLNTSYSNTNFSFSLHSIQKVNNTSWTTHTMNSPQEAIMKQSLAINPASVLNFYTCALSGGLLGYARFPWNYPENSYMHGVVVLFSSLPGGSAYPYHLGDTGVHEVGHFLGAFHTFQLGCNPPGDEVDDTPYEQSAAYGCPEGRNTCSQPGNDPIHNFMDYTEDDCMDHFTAGQAVRMDQQMSLYRPTMYNNSKLITVDQQRSNGTRLSGTTVGRWNGEAFYPLNITNAPATISVNVGSTEVLKSFQELVFSPTEKYRTWTNANHVEYSDVSNHRGFNITSELTGLISKFHETYSGVTIRNILPEANLSGGVIQFKDPWFIDYLDPLYDSKRNRGPDAVFMQRTSPFVIDYSTQYENGSKYQGVFFNRPIISGYPFYSIKAVNQPMNLGGSIGTRNFSFFKWNALQGANISSTESPETPVEFTSQNAIVEAVLKGNLMSNVTDGINSNSQRKIIRTSDGKYHMVYTSMDQGWYTSSVTSDYEGAWEPEVTIDDYFLIKNPSITSFGNDFWIAFEEMDELTGECFISLIQSYGI